MYIRDAEMADEVPLKKLYFKLLQETAPFGMDALPSDDNVNTYWDLMISQTVKGYPGTVLVAESGHDIVGALFWPVISSPIEMKEKAATGLGVYVVPEHRGVGLATELRKTAFKKLHEQGITHVLGFVHVGNEAGDASANKAGAVEVGKIIKFPTHA